MSNLLDKASIILTPTAYNNGEALCVKPSDGSGDFDFSRNSAATRVNAQGLVENVQILSSNLVQNGDFSEEGAEEVSNGSFSQEGSQLIVNGDFSNGNANWTIIGGNAEISNGKLNLSNAAIYGTSINNSATVVSGKTYLVEYTISDYVSGSSQIRLGSQFGTSRNSNGTFSEYIVSNDTLIRLYPSSSNTTLSIDNVSVREVGQDWSLGTGWSIGEDKVVKSGTDLSYLTQSSLSSVVGKTYRVKASISNMTTGNIRIDNFTDGTVYTSDVEIDVYYTATSVGNFRFLGWNGFNGSITNISVKEVGQNWTSEQGIWTFGDGVVNGNGATGSAEELSQNLSAGGIVTGDKVKLSFEIKNYVSGSVQVIGITPAPSNFGNGIYEYIGEVTSVNFRMRGSSFNGSITNISVIEITDDTNLPRINYEGFSYQDALGSEEVLNGGFDTNLNNWVAYSNTLISWESGGYALLDSNNNFWCKIKQSNVFEIGKTYKVILTAKSDRTDLSFHNSPITGSFSEPDTFETFEQYYTATTTDFLFGYANAGSATITIDNVSVKEVLGQEVVPDSGCGSWLFEPQSTNLITYSEDFSQSFWTKQASVTLDKGYLAPDGTYNATKISGVIGSSYVVSQGGILSSSSTKSIWAKTTSGTGVIHLGANQNQSNASFTVTNEWQRFEVTGTTTDVYAVDFRNASTTLSEVLVWGAQGENLSYATSYIPTNGESNGVTRNQDVCNNGGSLASINSTEGTLYAEISTLNGDSGSNRTISLSDSTNGNQIRFYFPINIESQIIIRVDVGGSTIYVFAYNIITSETPIKLAFRYSPNGMDFYVNGSLVSSSALVPSFTNNLNSLQFRRGDGQFGADFFGKTKALAVWKEALSDSELQSLTTI